MSGRRFFEDFCVVHGVAVLPFRIERSTFTRLHNLLTADSSTGCFDESAQREHRQSDFSVVLKVAKYPPLKHRRGGKEAYYI